VVKVKAIVKLLEQHGWRFDRYGKGDHQIYKHPDIPEQISVDGKPNEDVPKGTLNQILKKAKLK